nr:MAG TPA: hypothetical protein [Caudoviricetes sp.]
MAFNKVCDNYSPNKIVSFRLSPRCFNLIILFQVPL